MTLMPPEAWLSFNRRRRARQTEIRRHYSNKLSILELAKTSGVPTKELDGGYGILANSNAHSYTGILHLAFQQKSESGKKGRHCIPAKGVLHLEMAKKFGTAANGYVAEIHEGSTILAKGVQYLDLAKRSAIQSKGSFAGIRPPESNLR